MTVKFLLDTNRKKMILSLFYKNVQKEITQKHKLQHFAK